MAKKKRQLYLVPPNRYDFGAFMNKLAGNPVDGELTSGLFKGMSTSTANAVGAATRVAGTLAGGLIGGGMSSTAGNVIGGLSQVASAIPGPWGAVAGAGLGIVGGLVNKMFGSKLNKENIASVEKNISSLNSFKTNAQDYDALSQTMASQPSAMRFNKDFIGKDGWFSNKAANKFKALQEQQRQATQFVANSINNNANNIATTQAQNLAANFAALGGPLFMTGKGIMSPFGKRFDDGGLLGGPLHSYGVDWSNGLTFINSGDTHEGNPYEGVQVGVDEEGTPNLVEEGEVIWDNYVFSNRIRVPEAVRRKYKLRQVEDLTFADAVKEAQKESEERPNDPISQRGLADILIKLAVEQEKEREKMGEANMYAQGGPITIKKSKRGTFTEAAKKRGKSVQEFASQVLANPENYSSAMVKKANFARNAAGWQHAFGGNLFGLGSTIENWVNALDDTAYADLLKTIPNNSRFKSRADLIKYANTGKPGKVFNGITAAYNKASAAPAAPTSGDNTFGWDSFTNNLTLGKAFKSAASPLDTQVSDWIHRLYNTNESPNSGGYYTKLLNYIFENNIPPQYEYDPSRLIEDAGAENNGNLRKSLMTAYGEPIVDSTGKQIYADINGSRVPRYNNGEFRSLTSLGGTGAGVDLAANNFGTPKSTKIVSSVKTPNIDAYTALGLGPLQFTLPDGTSVDLSGNTAFKNQLITKRTLRNLGSKKGNLGVTDGIIERKTSPLEYLRYATILGPALGLGLSLAQKPDYKYADAMAEASRGITDVKPTPLGDYMTYNPFDRMFYLNQLNAAAGSNRRNILNTSGGNRGQAIAGLLASDNNTLNQMGQLARQGEEYNLAQREKVATFNRDTNKFNIENDLKAQLANAENFKLKLESLQREYALREAVDQNRARNITGNLTALFNNIGNLGIDTSNREDLKWLNKTGAIKGQYTPWGYNYRALGGRIKTKRRRGLTI